MGYATIVFKVGLQSKVSIYKENPQNIKLHILGKMVLKIQLVNELIKEKILTIIIDALYQLYHSNLNLLICETT